MKFDKTKRLELLQRMPAEMSDAELIEYAEMMNPLVQEAKSRVAEKESTRQNIDAKLDEILEYITSEKFPCDKEQLKAFLLKQLDDKYPSSAGIPQQNKKVKAKSQLPDKYAYTDANNDRKTWTGKGRMPKWLLEQLNIRHGNAINLADVKGKKKEELLNDFLIKKPTQQPN